MEALAERLERDLTAYTVRVHELDGDPVTRATVSIRGRGAHGSLVAVTLQRTKEPGAYRAVVKRATEVTAGRIRIATVGRVVEVPLE